MVPNRYHIQIKPATKPKTLKVATWNMLANRYATPEAFPHVNPDVLAYSYRHGLLKTEIACCGPDILCVQEFDQPLFVAQCGRVRMELINASHLTLDKRWNGLAMFYDPNKLRVVSTRLFCLDVPDTRPTMPPVRMMEVVFCMVDSEQLVQVINVHLKSKPQFEAQRVEQVKHILSVCGVPLSDVLIVAGDFNAKPTGEAIETMISCGLFKEGHDDTECDMLKSQTVTSAKTRDITTYMISDYIFYLPKMLTPVSFLDRFDPRKVSEKLLPHETYPSDHLLTCVEFEF